MIGYLLEQELGNLLPIEVPFATLLTMIEVDPDDPAFEDPTKFVGPVYEEDEATRSPRRTTGRSSRMARSGGAWSRRHTPSESSKSDPSTGYWIRAFVICAGGGGIPTAFEPGRDASGASRPSSTRTWPANCSPASSRRTCSSWPPTSTACTRDWGTPEQRKLTEVTPEELSGHLRGRLHGTQGRAAVQFVERTGRRAAIGSLAEIEQIVDRHRRHERGRRPAVLGHQERSEHERSERGSASTPRWASCGRSWSTDPTSACSG